MMTKLGDLKNNLINLKNRKKIYFILIITLLIICIDLIKIYFGLENYYFIEILLTCIIIFIILQPTKFSIIKFYKKSEVNNLIKKAEFKGIPIDTSGLFFIGFSFFMGMPFVLVVLFTLESIDFDSVIFLVYGLMFISIGIMVIISFFQSKLIFNEDGIFYIIFLYFKYVLPRNISYEEIRSIRVSKNIIRIKYSKLDYIWFIGKNHEKLISKLVDYYPNKIQSY
jgi:hypothetical protein